MKKIQLLHDYMESTGLIPQESMQIWATESPVFGAQDAEYDSHALSITFDVNLTIMNYPFVELDLRKIAFAVKWWLDVYEMPLPEGEERFSMSFDIKTSSTADIWIGLKINEDMRLENGKITSCSDPLMTETRQLAEDFILILKNAKSGEETQLRPPNG